MIKSFNNIKSALYNPPVLAHTDFKKPLLDLIDSSGKAIGAILAQNDEIGGSIQLYSQVVASMMQSRIITDLRWRSLML